MSTTDIRNNLSKLEAAVQSDSPDAPQLLVQVKIALTTLPALQPDTVITKSHLPEIALARDTYELATLLSVKQADDTAFERHVAQAKTYYVDYSGILEPSSRQNLILGLNLMRLMSQNRIAEFHTELELIPAHARSDKYIDYALRLEHYLMEGSYSKIRDEKDAMPDPAFAHFEDGMMVTVREEIAACCERAYERLDFSVAKRLLSLDSEDDVRAFCEEREWDVENNTTIVFKGSTEVINQMDQVPSSTLIKRSLKYAKELEQII